MWKSSHRIYRLVAKSERALKRRLTGAGMLLCGLLIAAGVLGVDTHQAIMYKGFGLALALMTVALLGALLQRDRFVVRRHLPRLVEAGQAFTYRVVVSQSSTAARDGLMLYENLAEPQLELSELRRLSRLPTYRLWKQHLREQSVCEIPPIQLPPLAASRDVEVTVQGQALRRGHQHFRGSVVGRPEPLGLMRSLSRQAEAANLLVLPKRYALPLIALPGTRKYQQGGVALASTIGHSEEFVGLRDYRPGDSLRNIHWKSFARVGEPVVREYQDEFFERHALVLDTFPTAHHDPQAFEECVSIASSFACTVNTQECLLDLLFVGEKPHCFTSGRGQMTTQGLLEVLAGVQPSHLKSFQALHDAVVERRNGMTGSICILLCWDEDRQNFVQHLRRLGVPVLVLLVSTVSVENRPPWMHVIRPTHVAEDLASL